MASYYTGNDLFAYLLGKIEGEGSASLCVKGVSASINEAGVVTCTVDFMGNPDDVLASLKDLPSHTKIQKIDQSGATTTILFLDDSQAISNLKIKSSAIFKSVSKAVMKLHTSGVIPQDIVPANEFADAMVYIKETDDIYEANGWLVSEIFDKLGLQVAFPNTWNYHVTQLSALAGTPVVSLIRTIFPFPGISIKRRDDRFIVTTPDADIDQAMNLLCQVTGKTKNCTMVRINIIGDKGELRYLRDATTGAAAPVSTVNTSGITDLGNMTIVTNKLGGVFGVTKVVIEQDRAQLPTELWRLIQQGDTK